VGDRDGASDGLKLGFVEGAILCVGPDDMVGCIVGIMLGSMLGAIDGMAEGSRECVSVGRFVGVPEGASEGAIVEDGCVDRVGLTDDRMVGLELFVGMIEGCKVGFCDGRFVGASEGFPVGLGDGRVVGRSEGFVVG
jgi:hypothetical protein